MIEFISKFRKAIRVSILWNRALDLASQGNFSEALQCMEDIDGIVDCPQIEFCLFKGFLYFATAKNEKSLKLLCDTHKMITDSTYYSTEEKEYLKCYASVFGEWAVKKLSYDVQHPFYVDYDRILLDKVPKHLREKFPLRDHPKWVDRRSKRNHRAFSNHSET